MDDESEIEVRDYPPWREALKRIVAAGLKPGDVIKHEWLYESLGLPMPQPNTPWSIGQRRQLEFTTHFARLRKELLRERCMDLTTLPGEGYRVTDPQEQVGRAEKEMHRALRKALSDAVARITNVDLSALSLEQQKQRTEALTRASMFRGMTRNKPPRLGDG